MEKSVEFLVCTIDGRIKNTESLLMHPQEGVSYLVAWQQTDVFIEKGEEKSLPAFLSARKDVRVVTMRGKGLSRNRNLALEHAHGDLLVVADDDCRYTAESVANIRKAAATHPDAAIMLLQAYSTEGKPLHNYSAESYEYRNRPRFSFVSSCELVMRHAARLPRFDERFGIGAYLGCGEEEVFVHEASRKGLKIYYEPLPLVATPTGTTGTLFLTSRAVQRAKGGVLCVMHGSMQASLRCGKYAFFYLNVPLTQRIRILFEMLKGIAYVLTHHPLP